MHHNTAHYIGLSRQHSKGRCCAAEKGGATHKAVKRGSSVPAPESPSQAAKQSQPKAPPPDSSATSSQDHAASPHSDADKAHPVQAASSAADAYRGLTAVTDGDHHPSSANPKRPSETDTMASQQGQPAEASALLANAEDTQASPTAPPGAIAQQSQPAPSPDAAAAAAAAAGEEQSLDHPSELEAHQLGTHGPSSQGTASDSRPSFLSMLQSKMDRRRQERRESQSAGSASASDSSISSVHAAGTHSAEKAGASVDSGAWSAMLVRKCLGLALHCGAVYVWFHAILSS